MTQYGGAGATNETLVAALKERFAIVTYRGHGSSTAWTGWAKDGKSFGATQISQLANEMNNTAIYFNIACTNAAIQYSAHSLAEMQLFLSKDPNDLRGAVAAIGATAPSAMDTNHRFAVHFFKYLQHTAGATLGGAYAAANNKLVQENGGSAPGNVKMYILLGDPLLPPFK